MSVVLIIEASLFVIEHPIFLLIILIISIKDDHILFIILNIASLTFSKMFLVCLYLL